MEAEDEVEDEVEEAGAGAFLEEPTGALGVEASMAVEALEGEEVEVEVVEVEAMGVAPWEERVLEVLEGTDTNHIECFV